MLWGGRRRRGTCGTVQLSERGVSIRTRDRAGSFEPQTIPKGQTRFDGFNETLALRRGLSSSGPQWMRE
jgi:hypothetical protein